MQPNRIEVFVRGMPPRPCATKEEPWRRVVADSCAKMTCDHEALSKVVAFEVTLVFFLSPARCQDTDLDNLAKPILDTIFLIDRPQTSDPTLTGALVRRNDNTIRRLTLEKRPELDTEHLGVDILVEWSSDPHSD
jgi:hypothetical protein